MIEFQHFLLSGTPLSAKVKVAIIYQAKMMVENNYSVHI